MSQQLQKQTKDDLEFKLIVRQDRKPTHLIPTAQLISKDMEVKVKDNNIIFETHGKAWLIEQIELSNNKVQSTLLQESTAGAWVAFETIHDKDVDIQEIFVQTRKASRDLKLMTYPLWAMIAALMIIEILLIKKTVIDKEVIILTKHDWSNFAWISIAAISIFALFFYYLINKKVHEAYFRITGHDYISVETLDFYFEMKTILTREQKTMRYTLTVQIYRGTYYHPDKPEPDHFANDREPLSTIKMLQHKIKMTNDAVTEIVQKQYDTFEELAALREEERDLEHSAIKKSINDLEENLQQENPKTNATNTKEGSKQTTEKQLNKDPIQELIDNDTELKEQRDEIHERQEKFEQLKDNLSTKLDILEGQLTQYRKQLFDAIKSEFTLDKKQDKTEQIQDIVDAHERAQYYRAELANYRNMVLNLRRNIAGVYDWSLQMDESTEQRVAAETARKTRTDYSYQILVEDSDGSTQPTNENQVVATSKRSGSSYASDRIINILVIASILAGIVGGGYWLATNLFDHFADKPGIATVILISLILLVLVGIKFANWATNYVSHTSASYRWR